MPPESLFFDRNDVRLYECDRVALAYDDELVAGTVTFNSRVAGAPTVLFDKPTKKRGVTSVRMLHPGLPKDVSLVLVFRPNSYEREVDAQDELYGSPVEAVPENNMCMTACDAKAPVRPEFLLEVTEVRDTKEGMSISVNGKEGYSNLGRTHAHIASLDRSAFDGISPGDRVLLTIVPVKFLSTQDSNSHELSI